MIEETDNKLLLRKNKWVLSHEENTKLVEQGAAIGIVGKNIFVHY